MELAEEPSNNGVFVPINTAKLIDDMLAVHGHEVLIDGVFNADPHPGNVLFIEGDKPGAPHKLGLIDYGQVKHIDLETRLQLARMMVLCDVALQLDPRTTGPGGDTAAHVRAKRAVVDEMVSFGTKTEKMDPEVIYKMGMLYYSRDDRLFTYPHNFQQYTDMLQAQDPMGSMDLPRMKPVSCSTPKQAVKKSPSVFNKLPNMACWRWRAAGQKTLKNPGPSSGRLMYRVAPNECAPTIP